METEDPDTELFQLDMRQNIQGDNNSIRYCTVLVVSRDTLPNGLVAAPPLRTDD
jgi:hypothetical protein